MFNAATAVAGGREWSCLHSVQGSLYCLVARLLPLMLKKGITSRLVIVLIERNKPRVAVRHPIRSARSFGGYSGEDSSAIAQI
jgi:hypothetical protein